VTDSAYAHPVLDRRFDPAPRQLTDDDLERLIDDFVAAARLAWDAGFAFVDVKQCHGYLGHELLGARRRPGKYGGEAPADRFRWVGEVIRAIQAGVPGLRIGVRLSAFDAVPFRKDAAGVGEPVPGPRPTPDGFGIIEADPAGEDLETALADSQAFLTHLEALGVRWVCITGGSPYYTPHITRPAFFPPADGYQPPEDPLRGVARQIRATALLKAAHPRMILVGSGYTYLQEWVPHVGQHTVRQGMTDFVGLGRMMLSYPTLPADLLEGRPFARARVCRTFSDCTTGPRLGHVSGCYPLDPYYHAREEAGAILKVRTSMAARS
jgi:2,4-dienoyl-CoA reductase-like NADH-dependent reductase (Old Yellow Enzyme family)